MFFVVIGSLNYLVWWSVFVVMDLVFVFICKSGGNYGGILNYFVFQEILGFLFLFLSMGVLQSIIVMSKMGLLPFHYWLFVVVGGLETWLFMWFLTLQKLPYMGILMVVVVVELVFIIVLSFFVCYFQLFLIKDYKLMLLLNSTESFNWILLGYIYSFFNGLVLFLYYFFLSLFLIPFFGSEYGIDYDWLVVFVYVNIPLGVCFFVKVLVISCVFEFMYVLVGFGVVFYIYLFFVFDDLISCYKFGEWLFVWESWCVYLFVVGWFIVGYFVGKPLLLICFMSF
uniref:NADH dehydrogenase subunit 3 n=1 Tax=Oxyuris equi TaxID=132389 RepID=A0A0G2TD02_9BILA|nr:NADH dehydrogenase subunit 3 [Oxyuris equi]AKI07544.1 NADH dehydrogenase subunit 3 [Oxyuris equi]